MKKQIITHLCLTILFSSSAHYIDATKKNKNNINYTKKNNNNSKKNLSKSNNEIEIFETNTDLNSHEESDSNTYNSSVVEYFLNNEFSKIKKITYNDIKEINTFIKKESKKFNDKYDYLFEPYEEHDMPILTEHKLGIMVSKTLCDDHDGVVYVLNNKDKYPDVNPPTNQSIQKKCYRAITNLISKISIKIDKRNQPEKIDVIAEPYYKLQSFIDLLNKQNITNCLNPSWGQDSDVEKENIGLLLQNTREKVYAILLNYFEEYRNKIFDIIKSNTRDFIDITYEYPNEEIIKYIDLLYNLTDSLRSLHNENSKKIKTSNFSEKKYIKWIVLQNALKNIYEKDPMIVLLTTMQDGLEHNEYMKKIEEKNQKKLERSTFIKSTQKEESSDNNDDNNDKENSGSSWNPLWWMTSTSEQQQQ